MIQAYGQATWEVETERLLGVQSKGWPGQLSETKKISQSSEQVRGKAASMSEVLAQYQFRKQKLSLGPPALLPPLSHVHTPRMHACNS